MRTAASGNLKRAAENIDSSCVLKSKTKERWQSTIASSTGSGGLSGQSNLSLFSARSYYVGSSSIFI